MYAKGAQGDIPPRPSTSRPEPFATNDNVSLQWLTCCFQAVNDTILEASSLIFSKKEGAEAPYTAGIIRQSRILRAWVTEPGSRESILTPLNLVHI